MPQQKMIQEPEELALGSEAADYTTEETATDIAVIENSETGLVTVDSSAYAGQPISRGLIIHR